MGQELAIKISRVERLALCHAALNASFRGNQEVYIKRAAMILGLTVAVVRQHIQTKMVVVDESHEELQKNRFRR
jgi:hypothetical protein